MHIMLDLETLSTRPNASIISIGAVAFSIDKIESEAVLRSPERAFYRVIDTSDWVLPGFHVSGETIGWWLMQNTAAQGALTGVNSVRLPTALFNFSDFIKRQAVVDGLWGNGAGFDNAILRHAYAQLALPDPVPFWMDRCYRTVSAMASMADQYRPEKGTAHNSLDDAITQAMHLQVLNTRQSADILAKL